MYELNSKLTEKIINIGLEVYRELGYGFRETIYSKSMLIECKLRDLEAVREKRTRIYYKKYLIEVDKIDLIINSDIIIEIKTRPEIKMSFIDQTRQYMKATNIDTGFLFNFGPDRLEWRRVFLRH